MMRLDISTRWLVWAAAIITAHTGAAAENASVARNVLPPTAPSLTSTSPPETCTSGPPAPPGPDYEHFRGVGHYKAVAARLTWEEARAACAGDGAHLVVVDSAEEAALVQRMVATLGPYASYGAHDRLTEGHFVTVLGDPLVEKEYLKWKKNEPNGGKVENCINLYPNGEMNDFGCNSLIMPYICEYPL